MSIPTYKLWSGNFLMFEGKFRTMDDAPRDGTFITMVFKNQGTGSYWLSDQVRWGWARDEEKDYPENLDELAWRRKGELAHQPEEWAVGWLPVMRVSL